MALNFFAVPGVSQPQMGLACFCCKTMWPPMMVGSLSSARRQETRIRKQARIGLVVFME